MTKQKQNSIENIGTDTCSGIDFVKFASRVRKRRNELGLTQSEAAARSGLSNATVSGIENCRKHATVDSAYRLANALETSVDYFLYDQYDNARGVLEYTIARDLSRMDEEKLRYAVMLIRSMADSSLDF